MKIALFGKRFGESFIPFCQQLFDELHLHRCELFIYQPFNLFLTEVGVNTHSPAAFYSNPAQLKGMDLVLSIGGDGTFLEATTLVRDSTIPVAGINSGRLGFLADISKEDIHDSIQEIVNRQFRTRPLSLIEVNTDDRVFGDLNFGLNELAITKRDSSSMITIHAYLNDEFLNSYWADGLIVSTATGSTAYSLSVGGPIVHPSSPNFVLSPIAPHNLTVRPLVIPDTMEITLKVDARGGKYLASLDSRSAVIDEQIVIRVKKAPFYICMMEREHHSYCNTLRNKLMWGADKRN